MSESETAGAPAEPAGTVFLKQLRFLLRRSWKTLRQSRLGMAGSTIVVIFALIALLAPWIAPYPKNFVAPGDDRFIVNSYGKVLPVPIGNESYQVPVMGPTTPESGDRGGSMWEINWARSGYIQMDLLRPGVLNQNVSPFLQGNQSLWYDLGQNFSLNPPADLPLSALYYIVPGQNYKFQFGSPTDNGALALFTGQDFIVMDPFANQLDGSVIFRDRIDFAPNYTGEDPASAGYLLTQPIQQQICQGILCFNVGPYRFFYASDLYHTVVWMITYVHTGDAQAPSGQRMFEVNESLSAPPLVYYNQERVTNTTSFLGGPGEGVLLPLTNDTLEVRNMNGTVKGWVPLTLGGEPAVVDGRIGYTYSTFPLWFYLPLKSATRSGLSVFTLPFMELIPGREFLLPDNSWDGIGQPNAYAGTSMFAGFYRKANDTTYMVGLTNTSAVIPQFQAYFPGKVVSYFQDATDISPVIIYAANHIIYTMQTTFATGRLETPEDFGVIPPKDVPDIVFIGALGGTFRGPGVSSQEVNAAFTDPASRRTVVFQLQGTPRTPLAPGVYDSGNRYILGTDFIGHDILTQVMWGTQIAFLVGILAALFAVGIGTIVGLVAGYYGTVVDTLLMRTTDVFLVLPFLPVVLILDAILKPSVWTIILVLSILGWPGIARVIRAQTLSLKERPFVDAARVSGASDLRLIFLHIAPNVLPFSFLYMSLTVASAIITEAALSFLGLGDATVISWGGILSNVLTTGGTLAYWWWLLPPGLCITFLSLGFYLLGRGFDEIINPRLRRR